MIAGVHLKIVEELIAGRTIYHSLSKVFKICLSFGLEILRMFSNDI